MFVRVFKVIFLIHCILISLCRTGYTNDENVEGEVVSLLKNRYQHERAGIVRYTDDEYTRVEYESFLKKLQKALQSVQYPHSFQHIDRIILGYRSGIEQARHHDRKKDLYLNANDDFLDILKTLSRLPDKEPLIVADIESKKRQQEENETEFFGTLYDEFLFAKKIACGPQGRNENVTEQYIKDLLKDRFRSYQIKETENEVLKEIKLNGQSPKRILIISKKNGDKWETEISIDDNDFVGSDIISSTDLSSINNNEILRIKVDNQCHPNEVKVWEKVHTGQVHSIEVYDENFKLSNRYIANEPVESVLDIYENPCNTTVFDIQKIKETIARTDRVLVTILDTGVDYNQPAIAYKIPRYLIHDYDQREQDLLKIHELENEISILDFELGTTLLISSSVGFEVNDARIAIESKMKEVNTELRKLITNYNSLSSFEKLFEFANYNKEKRDLESKLRSFNLEMRRLLREYNKYDKKLDSIETEIAQKKKERDQIITQLQLTSIGWDFVDYDEQPYDYHNDSQRTSNQGITNHGTHVADIASKGSDDISILPFRILQTGDSQNYLKAIDLAYSRGSRVFNMSFGSTGEQRYLKEAMDKYPDAVFIASAGNDNADLSKVAHYPTNYKNKNLIVVANVSSSNSLYHSSNFDSRGNAESSSVDIAAVGVNIEAAVPGGVSGLKTGTSMAAPQVSRVIAKIMFINPDLNIDEVINIVKSSVTPVESLKNKTKWGGVLNEEGAIKMAQETLSQ